jgi:hypothetical protein
MSQIRLRPAAGFLVTLLVGALFMGALLGAGGAKAQTPAPAPEATPAPATTPAPTTSSTVTDVEKWTAKQYKAARSKWAKDKAKWTDCQKQSTDQKLTGRKSWSFLYQCMSS